MARKKKFKFAKVPTTPKTKRKIKIVMEEFKDKKLKSSSGKKVTNPKQAIAIALSSARALNKKKKVKKKIKST